MKTTTAIHGTTEMGVMTIRNCNNCHHGLAILEPLDRPCVGKGGCYYDKEYRDWKPMTNGDKLRRLSDRELAARLLAWQKAKIPYGEIYEWLISEVKE